MTELEQKIITALGDRNLTMQEIADTVGIPASEMYQQGLLRLIGTGDVEKIRSDKMTVYRLAPQARVTRLACTPQARLDSTNHNIISQEKERECTVGYKGGIRGKRKDCGPIRQAPVRRRHFHPGGQPAGALQRSGEIHFNLCPV